MKHEPGIREQAEPQGATHRRRSPDTGDFARAKASYASGDAVDYAVVGQWLLTWGKPGRKPFGDWLQDQGG